MIDFLSLNLPNAIYADIKLSFKESFIILFFANFAGIYIRYLFIKFGNTLSSKNSFGNTLFLVTICVAGLISIVKSSLALSLGLVGALSIIRFRTVVKEAYTLAFILFAVCMGIALGSGQFQFSILFIIFGTISIFYIYRTKLKRKLSNSNELDTLNITADNIQNVFAALDLISKSSKSYSLKTLSSSNDNICVANVSIYFESDVNLNQLIEKISNIKGINNITFYNSPVD